MILAILSMGAEGRHRVMANRIATQKWFDSLPTDLADEANLALDLGEQDEVLGPDLATIEVGRKPSQLSPRQAMLVLARPLHVVLENHRHDRAALLAFAPTPLRDVLHDAEKKGWLEFWNGGGIHGCLGRAKQLASGKPTLLRTFIIVDSDAKEPGEPSMTAKEVQRALEATQTTSPQHTTNQVQPPGHVLLKRAMENYTPWGSFQQWLPALSPADRSSVEIAKKEQDHDVEKWEKTTNKRLHLVAGVLCDVPKPCQNHLDMHYGLEIPETQHNAPRRRTAATVWDDLSSWQQAVLKKGVGKKKIQDFFHESRGLHDPSGELVQILFTIRKLL